jgi:hypothetical protein
MVEGTARKLLALLTPVLLRHPGFSIFRPDAVRFSGLVSDILDLSSGSLMTAGKPALQGGFSFTGDFMRWFGQLVAAATRAVARIKRASSHETGLIGMIVQGRSSETVASPQAAA